MRRSRQRSAREAYKVLLRAKIYLRMMALFSLAEIRIANCETRYRISVFYIVVMLDFHSNANTLQTPAMRCDCAPHGK